MPKDGTEVGQLVDELLPVVNRFVDVYRYVADRAYLPPVQLTDIEQVQVLRPRTGEGQYVFLFGRGYEHGLINENRSIHERVIGMLVSGEQVPLAAELLFAARRLLLEGAWRQAVIEAVAAIEVTVEGLLRRALVVNEGLSEQEFAEFMRAAGGSLSDRMKAPMRRAIKWSPTSQGDLWNRWIAVNKVRRVVVHQGGPATKEQAEEAVAVSSELIRKIETAEAQFLGRA